MVFLAAQYVMYKVTDTNKKNIRIETGLAVPRLELTAAGLACRRSVKESIRRD